MKVQKIGLNVLYLTLTFIKIINLTFLILFRIVLLIVVYFQKIIHVTYLNMN